MIFNRNGILHIPLSEYAFATKENELVIRLRTGKNSVKEVVLAYGDTACRKENVEFFFIKMIKKGEDHNFDYYEARIINSFARVVYYFELIDYKDEKHLYYADSFYKEVSKNRNDLYKFPYIRREDIGNPPKWLENERFYNIFPDSFASYSAQKNKKELIDGVVIQNKNGGTIKEIKKRLDYINELGFNGIYLNPLFMAGEYHKYDVIDYFKVDPLFGKDSEFKDLVNSAHKKGMKVVIDLVLNHSGWYFFAFDDVIKNQENSKYVSWFYDLKFPIYRPKSWDEIPPYACFGYERNMPKLNTDNEEVINYFIKLCLYLIKEFNVDGFRLDTSDEVNDYFWIALNRAIKKENKDIALIGEIWENPEHWLNSLMFDSAMNYELRKAVLLFFENKIDASEFKDQLTRLRFRNKEQYYYSLLNILTTHDTPRLYSLLDESSKKYKSAYALLNFLLGAISVLYGEEFPIKGLKESEYRNPINFKKKPRFARFFKEINGIRSQYQCLTKGEISFSLDNGLLKITREVDSEKLSIYVAGSRGKKIDIKKEDIISSNGYDFTKKLLTNFGYIIIKG